MGTSNTIEQQQKLNAEFRKYIDDQTVAMQKTLEGARADLAAFSTKVFSDSKVTDGMPLIAGEYQHLTTMSEWSLDNVAKMIGSIQGAIFGGAVPAGSTKNPAPVPDKLTQALTGMEGAIAQAAMTAIVGILGTLTSKTTTEVVKNTDYKQVVPGLFLFISVIQYEYSRSDFFTNNTISQTVYVFQSFTSVQALGAIANINASQLLVDSTNDDLDSKLSLVKKLHAAQSALDPAADGFDDKYAKYQKSMDTLNAGVVVDMNTLAKLGHNTALPSLRARANVGAPIVAQL